MEQKDYKSQNVGNTRAKLGSSGHSRTTAIMNSFQLWLTTQDLHKISPVYIPERSKKGLRATSLTK